MKNDITNNEIRYIMDGNNFNQICVVDDVNGICRTIIGQGHANNEPKIISKNNMIKINQATKTGYIECCNDGVADFSYPNSKFRRGKVQDGGVFAQLLHLKVANYIESKQ